MGKVGEIFGVEPDESQKQEVIDEARTKGVSSCLLTDGIMPLEKC